ncbi:MAG: DUF6443 domain-containing protein [Reichenbachiella sp.]|uniref:DUF6443 domain-containing protein n=1 Tax=Reichenbachiella sp. TaxID=2184521 RepID=UPI0029677264|nr:DUF6443 domain-containing protein [Reichenbachiella sp.]MDW3209196.1 DUF6443 domain-containing protein [Reichenbachiella sp.]
MKNTKTHFNGKVITSGLLFLLAFLIFTRMAFAQGGGGTPPPKPNSSFSTQNLCGKVRVTAQGPGYPGGTNGDWYVHVNGGEIDGFKINNHGGSWYADVNTNSGSLFYVSASTGPNAWSAEPVYLGELNIYSSQPNSYELEDPGTKCTGGSIVFKMDGSQTGVTYNLKKGSTTVASKVGTGGSFQFAAVSAEAGTYSVTAVHNISKCTLGMDGAWTLYNKPPAPNYTISSNSCGDRTVSPGTPPAAVVWAQSNFTYVSVPDQAPDKDNLEAPTGGYYTYTPFDDVEDLAVTRTMNFRSMNTMTGCMSSLVTENIIVKPFPEVFTLNEPDVTCGGQPIKFKLSDSQSDATYLLQNNGSTVTSKRGTGSIITFTDVTSSGNYSAIAVHDNGCEKPMNETRLIDGLPDPPNYSISTNDCGDKTFYKNGEPPAGITWSTSRFVLIHVEDGPPDKDNLEAHVDDYYQYNEFIEDINLPTSRTFQLQSLNEVTGCLSSVLNIPVVVTHMPTVLDRIDDFTFCAVDSNTGEFEMTGLENDVTYSIEENRIGENLGAGKVRWVDVPQGRYTVFGERGVCGRNLNAIIHFNPTEMPTISNSTVQVFEGTTLDLNVVSGSDKGTWSGPGVDGRYMVAARAGLGNHQIGVYYDHAGCVLDDHMTVNVNPIPTLRLDGFATISPGSTVGMTIENYSSDYDYSWHKGIAIRNASAVTADQPGLYVLKAVTSSGYSSYSNSVYLSAPKQSVDFNHITFNAYRIPQLVESSLSVNPNERNRSVQYIDGLGQVNQVVQQNISTSSQDLVTVSELDEYGQVVKQYLPLPVGNSGEYKSHFFEDQSAHYTAEYGVNDGKFAYSETQYESSPIGGPLKNYAQGTSWAKELGNRPIAIEYGFNISGEVINWTVENNQPKPNSVYLPGKLHKTISKDENGKQVQEFKNLKGHVILKKVQLSEAQPINSEDWLQTYYIYDDYGNLRYVLPPEATRLAK